LLEGRGQRAGEQRYKALKQRHYTEGKNTAVSTKKLNRMFGLKLVLAFSLRRFLAKILPFDFAQGASCLSEVEDSG